jgi:hypothetical protein
MNMSLQKGIEGPQVVNIDRGWQDEQVVCMEARDPGEEMEKFLHLELSVYSEIKGSQQARHCIDRTGCMKPKNNVVWYQRCNILPVTTGLADLQGGTAYIRPFIWLDLDKYRQLKKSHFWQCCRRHLDILCCLELWFHFSVLTDQL